MSRLNRVLFHLLAIVYGGRILYGAEPPEELYLAQLFLKEKNTDEAEKVISDLDEERFKDEQSFLYGVLYYQRKEYQKAATFFESSLSKFEDRAEVALGKCYYMLATKDQDEEARQKAEKLLSGKDPEALFMLAQVGSTYRKREKHYRKLTSIENRDSPYYALGWYFRGLNDFEEGEALLLENRQTEAKILFERAVTSLKKTFPLLNGEDKGHALKTQAQAYYLQGTQQSRRHAFELLESLIGEHADIISAMEEPDEVYYLHALVASHISHEFYPKAEQSLKMGLEKYPKGKFAKDSLFLLGALSYQQGDHKSAETYFVLMAKQFPDSPLAGDAWFWASRSVQKNHHYKKKVFECYPQSRYASEAYFTYYSYNDYLKGDSEAIEHLHNMAHKFPEALFLINAHFLIGLDYKNVRKTPGGKLIHKKNLIAAIEAFLDVETCFDDLYQKGLVPVTHHQYFIEMRYRATLERALANLAIADRSQGGKKLIYLDYAKEVFEKIAIDFENANHPLTKHLTYGEPYPYLQEESSYWCAVALIKSNNDVAAQKVLYKMLEKYRSAKITRGYTLSRVWYEQGLIAMRYDAYELALECLNYAEDAAKGNVFTPDEKLELWIQQSMCYRSLGNMDTAMLILSTVINYDAVSSLRVKAMYLRSEIYELQERLELARKQLEATSKKGGQWALKAKERLKNHYVYQ